MKTAITIAAVSLFAAMTGAAAQPLKIGFVDVQQVLQESAPSKAAGARLENEFGSRTKELQRLEARLREASEKLDKDAAVLSEEERGRRNRDLTNQKRELERRSREFQEDAERRQQEEQRVVKDRFDKAVKQVFEAEKYDLILQDNAPFRSAAVDVTKKVLDAMAAQK
ncbi:outer membrane protein [Pelomonas saccharophila]|uniref:Outer membrane protein n=1 Tax=Roseateles saccharophilus TaxID=304 RepID=A0ABU1YJH9_ROSSA|nr:OmpH family outer membrane protein [Roseateles saccharophilus]MDR7268873.1 outer membrane protein [Roseateles saccharophilus]